MRSQYASKFVDAAGVRTHYIEAGKGEPVILIHGGGAGAESYGNWNRVIPLLAPHFRVIAIDMVGFGQTAKPDGASFTYSQSARNDQLIGVIEGLKLKRASIVGNSMGGATGIGVAVKRPDLVSKLILMGSAGLNVGISEALKPIIHYDFTREGMVKLIRALTTDTFKIDDTLVDERYQRSLDPEVRRAYHATMAWVKEQGGLFYDEGFLGKVGVPTLIMNGKLDKVVPLGIALKFLDIIPRSWAYFIPDCGHWAQIEHPEDFAGATRTFLQAAH